MLVRLAVDYGHTGQEFLDYRVPEALEEQARLGSRVQAPLGRAGRPIMGYITAFVPEDRALKYKAITAILDDAPLLDEDLVALALWCAWRYASHAYYVLEYILPKFARQKQEMLYHWAADRESYHSRSIFFTADTDAVALALLDGPKTQRQLRKVVAGDLSAAMQPLLQERLVESSSRFVQQGGRQKTYRYASCITPIDLPEVQQRLGRAKKQFELLRYLTFEGPQEGVQLQRFWPNYHQLVQALVKKGYVSKAEIQPLQRQETAAVFRNSQALRLNSQQAEAVSAIDAALAGEAFQPFLLHGVTGSGKTEVYLQAIKSALALGRGAMVLVPEIALTPQLIGRFTGALDEPVAVLHSGLADSERYKVWLALKRGEIRVLVGVRSAVFAPVAHLGVLIIDEEHETTFKQSEPEPRYHAREVALKRGEMNEAVVILGSATPSVESYERALAGQYRLLELTERAKRQLLPQVAIVDMAREFQTGNRSVFSLALQSAIEAACRKGEQVILYLNRRGFASSVLCRECGHTLLCPKCSIALTYHKAQNALKCHYCDFIMTMPTACPNCGSKFIRHFGSGTQLIEEQVRQKWPWLKTLRMDMDTTRTRNAHQSILEAFAKNEAQVLIGTQMIAKGLDFPNVTVVGIVAADIALNMPDYTASERNFQLLCQAAGRAGRGDKGGEVIIQTYNPEHYSVQCAKNHDYRSFFQQEIKNRQLLGYPPFTYLARFLVSDFDRNEAERLAEEVGEFFARHYPHIERLGPSAAPMEKIRGRYRFHLVLRSAVFADLLAAVNHGQNAMNVSRKSKTSRIIVDVEPLSIL